MAAPSTPFPPHPIRDVEARYVRQTSEPAAFAAVTVDFEPSGEPTEGLELEIPDGLRVNGLGGNDRVALRYVQALADGIAGELGGDGRRVRAATRVVLRAVRVHPIDSSEIAFRAVGHAAARIAVERAASNGG